MKSAAARPFFRAEAGAQRPWPSRAVAPSRRSDDGSGAVGFAAAAAGDPVSPGGRPLPGIAHPTPRPTARRRRAARTRRRRLAGTAARAAGPTGRVPLDGRCGRSRAADGVTSIASCGAGGRAATDAGPGGHRTPTRLVKDRVAQPSRRATPYKACFPNEGGHDPADRSSRRPPSVREHVAEVGIRSAPATSSAGDPGPGRARAASPSTRAASAAACALRRCMPPSAGPFAFIRITSPSGARASSVGGAGLASNVATGPVSGNTGVRSNPPPPLPPDPPSRREPSCITPPRTARLAFEPVEDPRGACPSPPIGPCPASIVTVTRHACTALANPPLRDTAARATFAGRRVGIRGSPAGSRG